VTSIVAVVDSMDVFLIESLGLNGQIFHTDLKVVNSQQKLLDLCEIIGIKRLDDALLRVNHMDMLLILNI